MGRPNDLFGPETLDAATMPARAPRPAPVHTGASATEDGLFTVSGMENVALVFLGMNGIREHDVALVETRLKAIADRSVGRVGVSLSEVVSMNSSGINVLVAVHAYCNSLGGHLALFALSPEIRRVFRVTKLDRKLVIAENAHEAVRSFSRPKRGLFKSALSWARNERDAA